MKTKSDIGAIASGGRPVFAAPGAIATAAGKCACRFTQDAIDGCLDGLIEVTADPALLEPIALSVAVVRVELFDLRFRSAIAGYNKKLRTLHLRASSFFAAWPTPEGAKKRLLAANTVAVQMTDDPMDGGAGYKRPPRHSQFQPEQSGNPSGRPKNARNFQTELLDELREEIVIPENGRERRISKQRAIVKALIAAAMTGDMRAINVLASICGRSLGGRTNDVDEAPADEDIDIVEEFVGRERKRRSQQSEPKAPNKSESE
jgi:hypothetical protein